MRPRVVALVPMRHSSQRVRGKNYRPLNGVPLFHHIVQALLQVPDVDEIVIDTDSDSIRDGVAEAFPERVRVIPRPEHLRAGEVPMNDVLLSTVERCPADLYLQTHSTNPLLRASTIARALAELRNARDKDSLFSVTRLQTRLWWSAERPVNHDPTHLLRTQDLPPVYQENSNIYLFTRESLRRNRNRIGSAPIMFEIDPLEAWDIDQESDFLVAELLLTSGTGV